MIRSLGPREAQSFIDAGGADIIDVRDHHDWAAGHVPGARNVPLEVLQANPRGNLPSDKVLFVCARGVRSMTAAKVAEGIGLGEIYSLEGGTSAWKSAGLPVETPPPATPAPAPAKNKDAAPPADEGADAEMAEAGLDKIVGANMRALREQRSLSLDALAKLTGLSRGLLGQIELGNAAPSVGVVWKIAKAFDVHFSTLLAVAERAQTKVLRGNQARRLVSPDGRFSSRALYPLGEKSSVEFYQLHLSAHSREDAQPHQPGTKEYLVVTTGRLELHVGGEQFDLAKDDAIVFTADVPHSYVNPGGEECRMYLVMTYTTPA